MTHWHVICSALAELMIDLVQYYCVFVVIGWRKIFAVGDGCKLHASFRAIVVGFCVLSVDKSAKLMENAHFASGVFWRGSRAVKGIRL